VDSKITGSLRISNLVARAGALLVLILLCSVIGIIQPCFLTLGNFINVFHRTAILLIVAIGMTYVIITGGIDLSVPGTMGLAGAVFVSLSHFGVFSYIALPMAILTGICVGLVNALLITKFKIAPFVVTFATAAITRSITWVYTGANPIAGVPQYAIFLGRGQIGIFPPIVLLAALLFLLFDGVLSYTKFGVYTYGIGTNLEAARRAGVNTKRHIFFIYGICGALAAIGGITVAARLNSAYPNAGENFELMAIAAVIVGGASLFGGEGNLKGTFIGALIIEVIRNGLNLMGLNVFWHKGVLGFIIIITVIARILATKGNKDKNN